MAQPLMNELAALAAASQEHADTVKIVKANRTELVCTINLSITDMYPLALHHFHAPVGI